nr:integrase, catalytic region, zinc finger, CCHC-type, peptidase aspartic, catalytic [Tanacetum cinerariifolium]
VIPSTSVSRPQLKSNPMEDRDLRNNSRGKKQEVEDHRRNVKLPKRKMSITACVPLCQILHCLLILLQLVEIVLFIVDSGCSKHMTRNIKLLINFVEKFLGTIKFGNDQIASILGYGDLVQGAITIKRVYYVEGLNHNLFSVGQFCDADLEVAFRKSTCFIRDLKGNDFLSGSRGTDLYSIILQDTNSPNPFCLVAKATSSQAWLWHRRLSYLNFDTINLLSKNDIVVGLPKLKFIKDHLCSSCELGKAKRKDGENLDKIKEKGDECIFVGYSTQSRAYRVFNKRTRVIMESIHVNFDELPQMASTYNSSDPAPTCQTMASVQISSDPAPTCQTMALEHDSLSPGRKCQENVSHGDKTKQVIGNPSQSVRTRRQLESDAEMCMFALTVSRTKPKNIKEAMADSTWIELMQEEIHQFDRLDVWELVDRPPIATACFTQNRSLVIPRHEKIPYHIINDRKPSVKFFHTFGSICYIVRDEENLDTMKEKGDECIFVGMASDQSSSDPAPECQTTTLNHDSLSPANHLQANVTQADRTITTPNDLDLLFSLMFDELLNESSKVVFKSSAISTLDAPIQREQYTTPLNIHTTLAPTCQVLTLAPTVISSGNINQAETYAKNDQVADDEFINIFSTPVQDQGETSSQQVIRNPSQPVRTRRQQESDAEMCMFALNVSQTEPKNIKEAMADSAWIESMQEELHQFD